MSTHRKGDRISLARHHHPYSPFNRAADSNHEFELDTSRFPSPSKQNGTRPRHSYRTGTLAGAYRATSRASMSEDGAPWGSTSSPRRARESVTLRSPLSETSNPPEELLDVYRRIEEDGTIADYVPTYDDWDPQVGSRPGSRLSRASSRTRQPEYAAGLQDGNTLPETNPIDGTGDHSLGTARRTDYTRDEQRLRRVTGKDSPIFSKANYGSRAALTADNLQRREEQEQKKQNEQHEQFVSVDDGDRGPSLNLPRTWGSRAARRPDWLRKVSDSTASDTQAKEDTSYTTSSRVRAEDLLTSRLARPSRVERSGIPVRNALGERNANPNVHETQESQMEKTSDKNVQPGEGAVIPNTPIVVFKNPDLTRSSTTKRDSQDLLRRLSRTESPKLDSVKTPDPPKLFERKIYDKTPRVTGAWIDTPMTERVTELPSDLTKSIVPSSALPKEAQTSSDESKLPPNTQPQPKSEDPVGAKVAANEPSSESQPKTTSRKPLIRPKLPKSALETVIEDVRSGKETLDVGDDTIESLHALIDDSTELKTEEEEEEAYAQEIVKRLELADTQGSQSVDMDRLNDKLQSLAKNITAVKKGLDRLEGTLVGDAAATLSRPISSEKNVFSATQPAEYTARPDGRLYAAIPLPRFWKRDPVSRRLLLTRLGCFTLVSLIWYIIECIMCEKYCHPTISETCDGYCLQPDAPEFPWVTVTMLWRWSHLSTFLTPIFTISVALFRLVTQMLGLWDGYVDEASPGQLSNIMGEIRINGTPVAFPWLVAPPVKNIAPPPSQQHQQPPPPMWTPRKESSDKWEEGQGSMDDDEYL